MQEISNNNSESKTSPEILNQLAQKVILERQSFYFRWLHERPLRALLISVSMLVVLAAIYILSNQLIIQNSCKASKQCNTSYMSKRILKQGVMLNTQTLNVDYLERELIKIFTPQDIDDLKKTFEIKFGESKKSLLKGRIQTAEAANKVLQQRLGGKVLVAYASAFHSLVQLKTEEAASTTYPIGFLVDLQKQSTQSVKDKLSSGSFYQTSTAMKDYDQMLAELKKQQEDEADYAKKVKKFINSYQPHVSFEWLLAHDWVYQLIFWTWFGVLVNNITWLIRMVKNREEENDLVYSVPVYTTLFARLTIAPIVSIVFLAMTSAGIASWEISNLNNLPAFLVAAFFLGFMSESVMLKMRQFFNKLLDSIKFQRQPRLALADITPVATYRPLANTSFANLEANMRALVNTEADVVPIKNKLIKEAKLNK